MLWNIHRYPLRAPPGDAADEGVVAKHLLDLISETRAESAEMFGESADNITAVCVSFDRIEPTNP